MRTLGDTRGGNRGFTLIELLVVVAIIALLISILLPSLSKARAQARTTLCASRMGQMGKGFALYEGDYESLPFICKVTGTSDPKNSNPVASALNHNMETWLGSEADMLRVAQASYATPGPYPAADVNVPRSGLLFGYMRFEALYRCPEFERVAQGQKYQSIFNYTRGAWCRKYRGPDEQVGAEVGTERINIPGIARLGDTGGPILTASMVHAPSALPMLNDEQWNRHIAGAWGTSADGCFICCDPVFDFLDELGQYHGAKISVRSEFKVTETANPKNLPIQRGTIVYYDGHAGLERDPAPSDKEASRPTDYLGGYLWVYIDMFQQLAYAQLGRPLEDVLHLN